MGEDARSFFCSLSRRPVLCCSKMFGQNSFVCRVVWIISRYFWWTTVYGYPQRTGTSWGANFFVECNNSNAFSSSDPKIVDRHGSLFLTKCVDRPGSLFLTKCVLSVQEMSSERTKVRELMSAGGSSISK